MKRFFTPRRTRFICFDLNGTLVDSRESFDRAFVKVLEDYTGRWHKESGHPPETALRRYRQLWKRHKLKRKTKRNMTGKKMSLLCLRDALSPYPMEINDAFLHRLYKQIRQTAQESPVLYPDAAKVLKTLSHNYRLAVVSNHANADVAQLGLGKWIPERHVIIPSVAGVRKPHPRMFLKGMEKLGVAPAEAVMVGNSWKFDIKGSTQAGMDAVWIASGSKKRGSRRKLGRSTVVIISRLGDLPALFT